MPELSVTKYLQKSSLETLRDSTKLLSSMNELTELIFSYKPCPKIDAIDVLFRCMCWDPNNTKFNKSVMFLVKLIIKFMENKNPGKIIYKFEISPTDGN